MNQYIKTPGEMIIRRFQLVLQFLLFFIFPAIVLYFLLIIRPGESFASNFIYHFGVVYVGGGFLILGLKLLELYDYGFILFKRRQWKSDPLLKRVFYKVCIPEGFNKKPVDMMGLYYDMTNLVGGKRTKHEIYNLGKWYYDWAFDIIVRNGKLEIYMAFPFKRTDFIMKTFKSKFPEIKLVQTIDPYEKWPKKWEPGKTNLGKYEGFHAFDFQISQGPQNLTFGEDLGDNNPITELFESFMKFDPSVMFIWQYVFRPFPLPKAKRDAWNKELTKIKSEILGRSNTFTYKNPEGQTMVGMSGDLVTDTLKRKINRMEQKLSDAYFRTHLKLMVFYPPGKKYYGPVVEKLAKAFTGQIYDGTTIEKNWFTANDRFFLETSNGMFDSIIAPFMDKFYHAKENIYRSKVQFEELAGRDPDVSNDSMEFMICVPEVCSLWHWPLIPTFPEEFKNDPSPNKNTDTNPNQTTRAIKPDNSKPNNNANPGSPGVVKPASNGIPIPNKNTAPNQPTKSANQIKPAQLSNNNVLQQNTQTRSIQNNFSNPQPNSQPQPQLRSQTAPPQPASKSLNNISKLDELRKRREAMHLATVNRGQ